MMPIVPFLAAAACTVTGGDVVSARTAAMVPPPAVTSIAVADSSVNRRLFEGGATMEQFLAAAKARREQWLRNYSDATVPDAVRTRASVGGPWKLLVVAVDGCSDSVNTIPFVARLAELIPGVDLRIVNSEVGRPIMDAHRTPDGRGATPTVVLLDAAFEERGCWIERPAELRDWILGQKGKLKDSDIFEQKMAWYDRDKGQSTMLEIATMIEAAAKGAPTC